MHLPVDQIQVERIHLGHGFKSMAAAPEYGEWLNRQNW
jgi:hypothetical protein